MKTLELFSGTKSASKVFAKHGWETFTIDNDPSLEPDLVANIEDLGIDQFPYKPDLIWASPPCQAFSVAAIGKNWYEGGIPKHERAEKAQEIVLATIKLIDTLKPKYWFIENPRGMLRKMPFMQNFRRVTVAYCQYGDTRQKPTDIWTNTDWQPRPMCSPGAKCHVAAPRGSKTGTQGLANAKDRGVIPHQLFEELIHTLEMKT